MAWRDRIRKRGKALLFLLTALVVVPVLLLTVRSYALVRSFEPYRTTEAAVLFDRDGRRIGSISGGDIVQVRAADIPDSLRDAIVAVEDRRFYSHPGVDPIGIARALWADLRAGARVQGASTITQQLARNAFLTAEKTITRKVEEAFLALMLELRFTKDQILAMYLNRIYLGAGAYGVERAARVYFGKPVDSLSLPESALLAALPRAPSVYDPYENPELALERRNLVLYTMVDAGYLSSDDADRAMRAPIQLAGRPVRTAAYFIDFVERLLVSKLGSHLAYEGGLRVYTTLDSEMQTAAEAALADYQGAIVAIDPRSGELLTMVGGRDYSESQFNRAVDALRQPGSAFKPFVYATAVEQGWRTNSLVEDIPKAFAGYEPENYDDAYWGPVVMKHALVLSLNNAAVWLLNEIGVDPVIRTAKRLGLSHLVPEDRHLALALGGLTRGVSPVEMALAYAAFANGGFKHELAAVRRVIDDEGTVWWEPDPPPPTRVLKEETAYLMTDMLRDVVLNGTGRAARLDRPTAGKTGTTNGRTDAWYVGYTPSLVAAVYIGNDDRTTVGAGGGVLAAPVWARFAEAALDGRPAAKFSVPDGIVTDVKVDVFTGELAGDGGGCSWTVTTAFLEGTEPLAYAACAGPPARYRRWDSPSRPYGTVAQRSAQSEQSAQDTKESDADQRDDRGNIRGAHGATLEDEIERLRRWFSFTGRRSAPSQSPHSP